MNKWKNAFVNKQGLNPLLTCFVPSVFHIFLSWKHSTCFTQTEMTGDIWFVYACYLSVILSLPESDF